MTYGSWSFTPSITASWNHDFINERETVQASYAHQSYRQIGATQDKNSYYLGFGLTAENVNGMNIGFEYSGELIGGSYKPGAAISLEYAF